MTIEQVAERIREKYEMALSTHWITKPMAWAIYQVWKEVDRDE